MFTVNICHILNNNFVVSVKPSLQNINYEAKQTISTYHDDLVVDFS